MSKHQAPEWLDRDDALGWHDQGERDANTQELRKMMAHADSLLSDEEKAVIQAGNKKQRQTPKRRKTIWERRPSTERGQE